LRVSIACAGPNANTPPLDWHARSAAGQRVDDLTSGGIGAQFGARAGSA
jgi:hypothetical protein